MGLRSMGKDGKLLGFQREEGIRNARCRVDKLDLKGVLSEFLNNGSDLTHEDVPSRNVFKQSHRI